MKLMEPQQKLNPWSHRWNWTLFNITFPFRPCPKRVFNQRVTKRLFRHLLWYKCIHELFFISTHIIIHSVSLLGGSNIFKNSASSGCKFPTMTKECKGGPKSKFLNSSNWETIMFWSGKPNRATPAHRVFPDNTKQKMCKY